MKRNLLLGMVALALVVGIGLTAKLAPRPTPVAYEQLVPAGHVMAELSPIESRIPYWTAVRVAEGFNQEMLSTLCRHFLEDRPSLSDVSTNGCVQSVLVRSGVELVRELRPGDLVWVPAPESTEAAIATQIERRTASLSK